MKSITAMSTRDAKYDYVRARPRKDKDKDSDKRSSIASSGGIIVRKHRDSTTSKSVAPSESASQSWAGSQSQSPDASSPESTTTSPSLRNGSAVSSTSCPPLSSIETPAALQPYLEYEAGDEKPSLSHESSTNTKAAEGEWIGPFERFDNVYDDSESSVTPKPMRRATSETGGKRPNPRSTASPDETYENPFLSTQINTSISPDTTNIASHPNPYVPLPVQPHLQPYPLPPPSPAQIWHDAPSQRSSSVASATRSVTSDPSSTITYIGNAQPRMLHPQENPMVLLQRVSNAMPDIYMLMQSFQEIWVTLGARESHIRQLEMQREGDSKRQDTHINRLTKDIEAMLAKHATKMERLETKMGRLEESKASLEKQLIKEVHSKEDATETNKTLQSQQKQLATKYLEEREALLSLQSEEKHRLTADHAASQRALIDHAQAQARIAEANVSARLGELNRLHEHERQALLERRAREKSDLEEVYAQNCRDLEASLATKAKIIEDERRDAERMRQAWGKEREELNRRRDEDRARHRKEMDDQFHDVSRKQQRERDEAVKSLEALHAGRQAKYQATIREQERALESHLRLTGEAQNTIAKLRQDVEDQKSYTVQIQEAFHKVQKENAELHNTLESVQSHQRRLTLQDPTRRVYSDGDIPDRSRASSRQG